MDRYDILRKVSEGGMGEVLLARATGEHGFRKLVAVKRVRAELSADPEFLLRFVTEAKVMVSLSHANIVQVFDLARAGPDLFLVMEYVRGADLDCLLRRAEELRAPVSVPVLLYIAAEALKGLAYAHGQARGASRGIIHCDISPSNLLLSYSGEVKIVDFGIAQVMARRQTRDGRVLGKKKYMSPEQLAGRPLDARADLFALAVVLKSALQAAAASRDTPVPAAFTALLDQASAADAAHRPADAAELLRAVSEISRQVDPMVTAPEVGAWVAQLVPALPDPDDERFGHAVRDLLGAAPRLVTRSQEASAVTFVTRAAVDGTTVWEAVPPAAAAPGWKRAARVSSLVGVLAALLAAGALAIAQRGPSPAQGPLAGAAPQRAPAAAEPPVPPAPVAMAPVVVVAPGPAPAEVAAVRPGPRAAGHGAARAPGLLNVFADPWATVIIDGRRVGTTPLRSVPLSPGVHRVRLEHPKRQPVEKTVTISPGRTDLVDVELAALPGLQTKDP